MSTVRVALVGCGVIGRVHAAQLALLADDELATPVVCIDPSSEARAATRELCGFERESAELAGQLDDVGAVLVATPTAHHEPAVRAALDAERHLFCEKPLLPSFAPIPDLCADVFASGVVAQVGFHSRFHPLLAHVRELVADESLGRPMGYVLRDDQFWPTGAVVPGHSSWRSDRAQSGGGALVEHSIHSCDVLCWFFGRPTQVFATTRNVFGFDVEDIAALTITHESGVVGTLTTVFNGVRGREERRLEVFFEHGTVEITTDFFVGAKEDSLLVQRPDAEPERLDVAALREAHFSAAGITRRDFWFYQYPAQRAWIRSIVDGSAAVPGFGDALTAHALVDAAYRSAATGVPEVPRTDRT